MDESKIDKLLRVTKENNVMLHQIVEHIERINSSEYLDKHLLQEFINNVVADLFADMLLQPKGRGHVSQEEIRNIINQFKM